MKRDSHILKIVNNGRTFNPNVGIKCYPRQTYGASEETPDQLKGTHSLISENGYIYNYDEQHLKNPEILLSQRKYCSVVGETIDVVDSFRQKYEEGSKQPGAFRKRKGRLSQFMDKNGWMNKVTKMMGFERSDEARQASNKDRIARIHSLVPKRIYDNPTALKPFPRENVLTQSIYSQKAKLRSQRFSLMNRKKDNLDMQRSLTLRSPEQQRVRDQNKSIQAESMTNKLAMTLQDKDWKETLSNVRKRHSPSKASERQANSARKMNLSCSDWSQYYKTARGQQIENKDELKDWFNSTCNSNTDPWKYRKPRKVDSQSSQQNNGPDD